MKYNHVICFVYGMNKKCHHLNKIGIQRIRQNVSIVLYMYEKMIQYSVDILTLRLIYLLITDLDGYQLP